MWEVEYTTEFEDWWHSLSVGEQQHIAASVELLQENGPGLGRPAVDTISTSRHSNMKELRAGTTRTLFAFDPLRNAILLLGGDKSGKWNDWYKTAISIADELYDEHLKSLNNEGLI